MTEQLTIIIPCFNVADTLDATLHSVCMADQPSGANIRVVLVNDQSPTADEERRIFERYQVATDSDCFKMTQVHQPTNKGLASSRNYGLLGVTDGWVMWLDSDDTIPKDSLVKRWAWKQRGEFHYGWYDVFDHSTGAHLTTMELQPFVWREHFARNIMPVWSGIIHRDDIIPFDESMRVAEDYDYTLRLGLRIPMVMHPEVVVNYRENRARKLTVDPKWQQTIGPTVFCLKNNIVKQVLAGDYVPGINGLSEGMTFA